MIKTMEVENKKLKVEISKGINVYDYNYGNDDLISCEFKFKTNEARPRHSIMLSSRFNKSSREENGPFPGWFVQIVGNSLSIAIGNGKAWLSLPSSGKIMNEEWNHVAFSIDNKAKKAFLYLNGNCNSKNNFTFKRPCNLITAGALNKKGEFKFNGELSNIVIGTGLIEKENKIIENTNIDNDINLYIKEADEHIKVIKNNIIHLEKDIESLEIIEKQILSWKYRGLDIDIELLENQIEHFKDKKDKLELETKNAAEVLFKLDYKISPNSDNSDNIEKENYYDFYSTCLHNLKKDIDMLNNAVNDLSKFTNLGIELGNAFEKVNEQKDYLVNKIIDANKYLKNMEKTTFEMMDIVTINDNS